MTSDGPYPPGYEPANGGTPYGRYPGEEPAPDGPPARPSASARVNPPGAWGPPPGADQYGAGQYGAEQPPRDQPPRDQVGPPPGYSAVPGQYRPGPPPPTESFRPSSQSPGVYGAPAEPTQYGTPTQYGSPNQPTQYGPPDQPTQYGSPNQYGAQGDYGSQGEYGAGAGQRDAPTQYGTPTQYGSQAEPGAGGQYGATTQWSATQYGTPPQQGNQYGAPTQYGSGQGGQYDDPEAQRFGPSYGDAPAAGEGDASPKSRKGLVIGAVIAVVVIIALVVVAVVAKSGGSGGSSDYAVGSCVKEAGAKATKVACTESGAYSIVNKVDSATKCADQTQPYVILHRSGSSDEVLCLKPAQ